MAASKTTALNHLAIALYALTGVEPATMDYETTELPFTLQCEKIKCLIRTKKLLRLIHFFI